MTVNKNHKLLISFLFDNSFANAGAKLNNFVASFNHFCEKVYNENLGEHVEFSLHVFGTEGSECIKKFSDKKVDIVKSGKMPFLNEAIETSLRDMVARKRKLTKLGFDLYKPWFFMFSGGHSLDDVSFVADKLDEMDKAKTLLYMPFITLGNAVSDKLEPINKNKRVLRLKDMQADGFFDFVFNASKQRLETVFNKGIKFDKNEIERFAIL